MCVVQVGERKIGARQPCFLAAEIGINHNGDMALAHRAIDAAADAGADAVKFQNYFTEDFLSDRSLTYQYQSQGRTVVESQYDMFKRCELAPESLLALREHCDARNVVFFCTPMGQRGVEDLLRIGTPMLKNGSDCLGHLPLIRAMARTGLPTAISTGMATLAEIDEAVRAFREAGGKDLILLQCTSSYPTPPDEVNLRVIPALSTVFGCPAGLSDHTAGFVAALGAVAVGACFIEKHFTLDRNLPGPDHWFSSDPREFQELVQAVRILEKNLGTAIVAPAPSESVGRREYKLSCVAARDLPRGHRLEASDIEFHRPGWGLPPAAIDWILNRRVAEDLKRGKIFTPTDFT